MYLERGNGIYMHPEDDPQGYARWICSMVSFKG